MYLEPRVTTPLAALFLAACGGYLAGLTVGTPATNFSIWHASVPDAAGNPRQTIFDELSPEETRVVAKYVMDAIPGAKTSMYPDAPTSGTYISGTSAVELLPPPKAAAIAYVDGVTDDRPPRYAKVTVVHGDKLTVMEYKVGPLHGCDVNACDKPSVEEGSPLMPLVEEGAIPFEKRPMDLGDTTPLLVADKILGPVQDLLVESFGPVWDDSIYPNCGERCYSGQDGSLYAFAFNDISSTAELRVSKIAFFWYSELTNFQAVWVHPLPFTFRVAQKGADVSDWTVFDVYYCGQGPFKSSEELLASNPEKCTYKPKQGVEGKRGSWDVPGAVADRSVRPALLSAANPPPPRYTLNGAKGGGGRLVQWQGWSFFTTLRPSTGLVAMDIKFKGTRIAYELALSEAAAHYSGTGADQVFYLDSAYSMSQLGGDIKPGIDCPEHATFLNSVLWVGPHEKGKPNMDSDVAKAKPYKAFCIFEEDAQASHWRHLQHTTKSVDGVPSSTLVIRAVTAVGNYDYITEYKFGLDGSIHIGFDFAGYMETRWFSQSRMPYERALGEIVRDNLAAPLHSHFGCFKVDLEGPKGEGESVETITVKAGMNPEVPDLRGWATKYVERGYPTKEGVGVSTTLHAGVNLVDRPADAKTFSDATPTSPAGYMIKPGPTVPQVLPDDHPFVKASAFSKYTVAVTRRKESETRPTSVYDLFGPGDPYVSLDTFIDGEDIVQKDLVAWVNLGKEHLPRTEDLPLISNFGTYFDLLPRNMHQVNAAMDVYTP